VEAVLRHLDGELEMTMRLAGVRTIAEISGSYVSGNPAGSLHV
jgi:isopentenyl diphosphate isomerase/L-lactate dehydrogenase-like FMN-dependent dehydrogenase